MEIFTPDNVSFMLGGFAKTLVISFFAIILSIVFGTVLAMVKQFCKGKLKVFSLLVSAYIELFRCTPNLLWILFIYFTVKGNDVVISVLAFTIFTSAVMAEIIRGGFNSIPKSQFEAAQSQGFGFFASMRLIILPQTFKTIIPALFSQCTTVIKDSSYLAGINVAEMYLAPLALADSVLTEAERRSGCVLVDMGADTTTVAVFSKNILRHLAVIPLGSANITKDIASLQMEEADAEKMKLKYGSAYTDNTDIDNSLKLPIDADRSVESRKFVEIVEGRLEEIIENVWYQIPSEYYDKLLGGIILTGGGSNMKNIERAFMNHTHVEKIRVAKFVTHTIHSTNPDITVKNGTMNTVLGLLAKGDINCAGGEVVPGGDIFTSAKPAQSASEQPPKARQPHEIQPGVVQTEAEKRQAEEEARLKREEEERLAQEREQEEKRRLEEEKKQNSPLHKFIKRIKDIGRVIISEE